MDAIKATNHLDHVGFFVHVRYGKTIITLRRIQQWGFKSPNLILCPGSAIQSWLDDCKEEGYSVLELEGPKKHRIEQLQCSKIYDYYVTNKESHLSIGDELKTVPWNTVVVDESRFLAGQSKYSRYCINNFRDVNHRITLTGTPDFRDNLDYYNQLKFLRHDILPYTNFWHFRNSAFNCFGYTMIMKKKHEDILKKTISENCVVVGRNDFNGGRTPEYHRIYAKMPRKLQKEYDKCERAFVLEGKKMTMKTLYATVRFQWLMRMCGGFIDGENVWEGKYKVLKSLFDDNKDEQFVVACRFKEEIYYLQSKFKKSVAYCGDVEKKERRVIIENFKQKKIQYLFLMPQTVAHGVNLASATNFVRYSQPSGHEITEQSEKRLFTLDDENVYHIYDILVKDTVDEDARESFLNNESSRNQFNRAIQRCR